MTAADAGVTIVFNGEIYNYIEIRQELKALGHVFQSSGDTEVLLKAYLQWGSQCVTRLNGMWAFVIHDRRRNCLFGSRDRFGIKPLYRFQSKEQVLFASEIKAIRASGAYQAIVNWPVAARFLLQSRLDEGNESFFQDINQIGPGCAFELNLNGKYREWSYWSIADAQPLELVDPAAQYAALFEDAMRLHMRSDVPVGVHLSGGLDSTSIACASARIREAVGAASPLMAFCFMPEQFDESTFVNATIEQTGAIMEKLVTDANQAWDALPRVLWYQDEPVHSMTAAISFQLMELTALRGLKVVLNGQGADETAAGYPTYFTNYWYGMLRTGNWKTAWDEIAGYSECYGRSPGAVYLQQLLFLTRSMIGRSPVYRGLSQARAARVLRSHRLVAPEIAGYLTSDDRSTSDYRLHPTLVKSVSVSPLPLYLRIEDRNASAHSIESRVPFLDYRLVEFLFSLPDNWRMRGPWNKYIQREAMRGAIPEKVRSRVDKMGFPTPAQDWFKGPLYEPLRDLFSSREMRERGIFNIDAVVADLDSSRRGERPVSGQVFDIAEFELWCRQIEKPQTAQPQ